MPERILLAFNKFADLATFRSCILVADRMLEMFAVWLELSSENMLIFSIVVLRTVFFQLQKSSVHSKMDSLQWQQFYYPS